MNNRHERRDAAARPWQNVQMMPERKVHIRSRLPLLAVGVLLLLALFLPAPIWTAMLAGLIGLLIASYGWARALAGGLHGQRKLRFGWVGVGDRLSEAFAIYNGSHMPAFWVQVVDDSNVPGYNAGVVHSVGPGGVSRWRQAAVCQQRGQYRLGPWRLRTADPVGLFEVTVRYPAYEEIIIHPPIHGELAIPLPAGQSSGRSRAQERSWQATINAAGVRDYRTNDPYRWIHWPTSARKGELFVREFDLDAAGDVWILLDMEATAQVGRGPQGTEEHAVLLAASLAARALYENRAIGLAAYGRTPQVIAAHTGAGQQWRLLRALALITADGESGLAPAIRDLGRRARRGSAAVIITPTADVSWLPDLSQLSLAGIRCNVILLDRASFGAERGNRGLCDAIRHLGIPCRLSRQGDVGQPAEERERQGFWEFKTLATGRVVVVRRPGAPG